VCGFFWGGGGGGAPHTHPPLLSFVTEIPNEPNILKGYTFETIALPGEKNQLGIFNRTLRPDP
jgi:hypothetical protein